MKKEVLLLGMLLLGVLQMEAQSDSAKNEKKVQTFSLEEAQKFAVANSPLLKNSNIDLEIAKKKIWETTAIGLPQVNAKFAASYMLKVPELFQSFSGLGNIGTTIGRLYSIAGVQASPMPDAAKSAYTLAVLDSVKKEQENADAMSDENLKKMKWGATFDVTVSQLLFSGAYLVGLQTTKAFKEMSALAITKSVKDLQESVSNAYHLVLVLQENRKIMQELYEQTSKTATEMEATYKAGFIEETTVDQLKLSANNLKNTLAVMDNQIEVAKNLLRLQMGFDMANDIQLTEQLDNMLQQNIQLSLLTGVFDVDKNIDFQILKNATRLKQLQLKYQKSMLLPDVAAFYQFDHQFNENSMSFTPPHVIGAAVSIPIFGSGQKLARIKQASLDLEKARNTEYQVSQGLQLAYSQARATYSSALAKLDANKENMDLSKKIYDRTLIKFKNGVSTSVELTQIQTQLLQMQTAYYSTVIELVNAKNTIEKLLK